MTFPEPDLPDGSYKPITALKCLREASKVIERQLLNGMVPSTDDVSDFANAIIISNSVRE